MGTCSSGEKISQKCKLHQNQNCQDISIGSRDPSLSIFACKICKQNREGEEFIQISQLQKQLQAKLPTQSQEEMLKKLENIAKSTEKSRKQFIEQVEQFCQKLSCQVQNLFVHSIIKSLPNQLFTVNDVYNLLQERTVADFRKVIQSQIKLDQMNETNALLLAKMYYKEQEAKELINSLPNDTSSLNDKLQNGFRVCQEILINLIKSAEAQINVNNIQNQNSIKINNEKQLDRAYTFLSKKDSDPIQKIKQINRQQAQFLEEQQREENPQIKQIIEIDEEFVAFCSGTKIFTVETQNQQIKSLDCEGDVTSICALEADNKSIIVSSVEESDDLFQLIFWDWKNIQQIRVINAHQKYIWKVINLPDNWIASCSDDQTIKIYDDKNIEEKNTLSVHQGCVNDIALINLDIIISVSDDLMVAASNFRTGEQLDILRENSEIKCVVALDGINFVTGNCLGEARVYMFSTNKIVLHQLIKVHESVVRFISRISSNLFVTSSWDGTNKFINVTGQVLNQILEGSRKNFPEPILWSNNSLWASIGGQLYIY